MDYTTFIFKKIVKSTAVVYNVPLTLKRRTMFYTGIGSRNTPATVLALMRQIGYVMAMKGYTLRSGGAEGADTAFAEGWGDACSETVDSDMYIPHKAEIYLPWNNFNDQTTAMEGRIRAQGKSKQAHDIAEQIHPNWKAVSPGGKLLHMRNIYQVLGADLETPSDVVVFYAEPDGDSVKGGTRTAVELAKREGITVCNLYDPVVFMRWNLWVLRQNELIIGEKS